MNRDVFGRIARDGALLMAAVRSRIGALMKKPIKHTRNPDGTESVVGVVRVLLFPEGSHVVAQGLDVDYCTAGETIAQAQENFVRGFEATVRANLREFGSIDQLIEPAPAVFFRAFYKVASELESKELDLPKRVASSMRRLSFFEGAAPSAA